MEQVTMGHLGGYVPGGDPATAYPDLWTWLVDTCGVNDVIDVGCGDGYAVEHFNRLGVNVLGIDGIWQDNPLIVQHDYTLGPYKPWHRFDLVWCCEFVEHVEEQYVPNFMATFQSADLVLMTHADVGQAGHHHVNCQPASYWIEVFGRYGFDLDPKMTAATRAMSDLNTNPWNHYSRSGMAFRAR